DAEGYEIVGARCFLETCQVHDFLPFTCALCRHQFCQKHAEASSHDCQQVTCSKGILAAPCPVCGVTVKWDDADSTEEE
ncbi:unnamed protein product, partial [Polarella glacialis]